MEHLGLDFAAGGGPVADDFAILENHGPEDAFLVVGMMAVVGVEGHMAALVADEVFVVGREEVNASVPESPCTAVLVAVEGESLPALLYEFILDGLHSLPAVADVQSGPPHEVFHCGGTVAAEVGSGELGQGFFLGDWFGLRKNRF